MTQYFTPMKETTITIKMKGDRLTTVQGIIAWYKEKGYECCVKETTVVDGKMKAKIVYWKLKDNFD